MPSDKGACIPYRQMYNNLWKFTTMCVANNFANVGAGRSKDDDYVIGYLTWVDDLAYSTHALPCRNVITRPSVRALLAGKVIERNATIGVGNMPKSVSSLVADDILS